MKITITQSLGVLVLILFFGMSIVIRPDEYHAGMYAGLTQGQTVTIMAGNQDIKVKINALDKYGVDEYLAGAIWGEVVLPDSVAATMDMRRVGKSEEYVLIHTRGQMAIPKYGTWEPCDCKFRLELSLPAE